MSFEAIDEWDENFLDEAIRVELEALASRNPPSNLPNPTISRSASSHLYPSSRTLPNAIETPSASVRLDSHTEQEPLSPLSSFRPGARVSTIDGGGLNFSPPRELSQRYVGKHNTEVDCEILQPSALQSDWHRIRGGRSVIERDREVERLKRELGRVSRNLKHSERECVELKKERNKSDEKLRCAFSEIAAKEVDIDNLKKGNVQLKLDTQNAGAFREQICNHASVDKCTWLTSQALDEDAFRNKTSGENGSRVPFPSDPNRVEYNEPKVEHVRKTQSADRIILDDNSLTSCLAVNIQEGHAPKKAARLKRSTTVGTQTENFQGCGYTCHEDSTMDHMSRKLLGIWDSPNSIMTEKNMISRLLVSCAADFCELFRCMNMAPVTDPVCPGDKNLSNMNLHHDAKSIMSEDTCKVLHLYSAFKKMHSGMAHLHDLLEALIAVCTVENAFMVHRSLRIVHAILKHLLIHQRSNERKNVIAGQPSEENMTEGLSVEDRNDTMDVHHKGASNDNKSSGLPMDIRSFDFDNMCRNEDTSHSNNRFLSSESLISIFKSMQQTVMRNTNEDIRVEALSVMILIMMESNPNTERSKFGLMTLVEVTPKLLRKETGSRVQKHALHLLFLLLNCPKMLMLFCTGGKHSPEQTEIDVSHNVELQSATTSILEGLSECLSSTGTGTLELKLRKQAIILLAYVASCGKSGFEVMLKSVGPQGANFLQLIIQILAFEIDVEMTNCASAQVLCKERTLLFREALILLNRLASHPVYSRPTLEALMSCCSIASVTVDVVSRLPTRCRAFYMYDDANQTQIEAETMDLARLLRASVFAFLGGKQTS